MGVKSRKAEMSPEGSSAARVQLGFGYTAGNSGTISVKPLNLISVHAAPDFG